MGSIHTSRQREEIFESQHLLILPVVVSDAWVNGTNTFPKS